MLRWGCRGCDGYERVELLIVVGCNFGKVWLDRDCRIEGSPPGLRGMSFLAWRATGLVYRLSTSGMWFDDATPLEANCSGLSSIWWCSVPASASGGVVLCLLGAEAKSSPAILLEPVGTSSCGYKGGEQNKNKSTTTNVVHNNGRGEHQRTFIRASPYTQQAVNSLNRHALQKTFLV